MPSTIATHKAQVRAQLRACYISPRARQQADIAITARVLGCAAWQTARTLFLYSSMPHEPQTRLLVQTALAQGKRVCLPVCLPNHQMQARQITSFAQLVPQQYGILAPDARCPLVPPEEIDLILAPCVGVSARFQRMGNGGGYYDRFFPKTNCPRYCLCYHALLLPTLPTDPYDVPLDGIITEQGVLLNCTGR